MMVDSYNFLGQLFCRLPVSELLGHFGEPFPNPRSSLRGFHFVADMAQQRYWTDTTWMRIDIVDGWNPAKPADIYIYNYWFIYIIIFRIITFLVGDPYKPSSHCYCEEEQWYWKPILIAQTKVFGKLSFLLYRWDMDSPVFFFQDAIMEIRSSPLPKTKPNQPLKDGGKGRSYPFLLGGKALGANSRWSRNWLRLPGVKSGSGLVFGSELHGLRESSKWHLF